MHKDTIYHSVLIVCGLCAKYCEHWTMFDKNTFPQIQRVFFWDSVYLQLR